MSYKFDRLMEECGRINPDSLTSQDQARVQSVEAGLLTAQESANWQGREVLILGAGDGYEVTFAKDVLHWKPTGLVYLQGEADASAGRLVVGDMHDLPFPQKTFDAVYSKEVLEHSPCPYLALLEINRVLKPDGQFFHHIPWGWDKQRDWYHFSCFPPDVWCDLMRKAYLKVSRIVMEPDCERCSYGNVGYVGSKECDRVIGMDSVAQYKAHLGFTQCRSSEGLQ